MSQLISSTRRHLLGAVLAGSLATALPGLSLAQTADTSPIRIGVLVPLSGGGGAYGEGMANAALKAAEYINNAGGVLGGRKLQVLVEDSESNPTSGVAAIRKLLDVSNVSAIVGLWSSAVAMAVKPLAIEKGVPLMVSGSGDEVTQGDNKGLVWRFQARGSDWGAAFGRAAFKDGARTASLLVLQTPFTLSMVEPFATQFKREGGQILDIVYYNPNQPSYRAEVEKVFSKNPDAVFIPSYLPDLSAIAREVYRGGFTSRIYANSSAADAEGMFIKNVGNSVSEGIHHIQSIPPANSQAYKTFAQVVGVPPDRLAIFPSNIWDGIAVLALAIEHSGSSNPAVFSKSIPVVVNGPGDTVESPLEGLKALQAGKKIAYSGAGSQFKFTATGDQLNREYGHFIIKNGANQLVEVLH